MNNGMKMLIASQMQRQRDGRGRYMDGGQGNYNAYSGGGTQVNYIPYNGMEEGNRSVYRRMENDPPAHRNPRPEDDERRMNWDMPPRMTDEGQNPYGEQPEVYRQQERKRMETHPEMRYVNNITDMAEWKHKTDPLNQHDGKERMIGFKSRDQGERHLDKQTAMEWVEGMEDSSGVRGGKYTWHQAQQMGQQAGIRGEEKLIEFYAIVNAMYSDYCAVAKKFGVDRQDFYACLAKAFMEDKDAVEDKVYRYYEYIAK